MKQGLWIVIVMILVLALGIETSYLLRGRKDTRNPAVKDLYRPPMAHRVNPPAVSSFSVFQNDPFQMGGDPDSWNPFQEKENMQKAMNHMFHDNFSRGLARSGGNVTHGMSYNPDIDIKDAGKEYLIRLDLPVTPTPLPGAFS